CIIHLFHLLVQLHGQVHGFILGFGIKTFTLGDVEQLLSERLVMQWSSSNSSPSVVGVVVFQLISKTCVARNAGHPETLP
ncbi:hypothetical protein U9M48_027428, partial [Paspalum notatum var. saurae]